MKIRVLNGNCLDVLSELPEQSVNACITSPPYWGLRDYGTAKWEGGDDNCDHVSNPNATKKMGNAEFNVNRPSREATKTKGYYKNKCSKCGAIRKDSQLGLEDTPEEYVKNMVEVFREVKRVLRDDGTVWLNLGDSYVGGGRGSQWSKEGTKQQAHIDAGVKYGSPTGKIDGLKPKDLVGIPWRVAFALQADGWYLRQDIIWHKPNPMPESVTDRCTKSHEYIFLLSKNKKYYYDNEAIKEDAVRYGSIPKGKKYSSELANENIFAKHTRETLNEKPVAEKRNKRSVWIVATKPYREAHFATFPPDLIEPCVLAGCPEKVCVECATPYERKVESKRLKRNELSKDDPRYRPNTYDGSYKDINGKADAGYTETKDLGLEKQCQCESNETKAGTVLDPFGGSGTTGVVANRYGRNAILIELNDEYAEMSRKRIYNDAPLFVDVE